MSCTVNYGKVVLSIQQLQYLGMGSIQKRYVSEDCRHIAMYIFFSVRTLCTTYFNVVRITPCSPVDIVGLHSLLVLPLLSFFKINGIILHARHTGKGKTTAMFTSGNTVSDSTNVF